MTLDTNVLASGLTRDGGVTAKILNYWRSGAMTLITSQHILDERARALTKPYFASNLSEPHARALVRTVVTRAIVVELSVDMQGVAAHPEDDKVLATALSGQSNILCTGDKQLSILRKYEGIEILSPAKLPDRLARE